MAVFDPEAYPAITRDGPFLYVVQAGENGPLKIGITVNPRERFVALQVGCPWDLIVRVIVAGNADDEAALHRRFRIYAMRGEWFRCVPEILEWLEALQITGELDRSIEDTG